MRVSRWRGREGTRDLRANLTAIPGGREGSLCFAAVWTSWDGRTRRERHFRAVFPHARDVGGRYAALTVVGMLPAALAGIDGRVLLERALAVDPEAGRALGARIAAAALAGLDKLVLHPPAAVARLADWIEQLVAERTGKGGRGGIPVGGDPVGAT